jgi:anti-sigma regulatory factor (Ser/Thr protein kinase)
MKEVLRCTYPGDLTQLQPLANRIDVALAPYGLPESVTFGVQMAFDEIFSNAVKYAGNESCSAQFAVAIFLSANSVILEMEYDGVAFNVLEVPPPVLDLPLQQRPVGGLGLHLVRQWVDEVEYQHENGRNTLRLTIRFDALKSCKSKK